MKSLLAFAFATTTAVADCDSMLMKKRLMRWCAVTTAWALLVASAFASIDDARFPERPIRIVVPYPAGGSTDALARVLGQRISKSLGQPVVIDNRAGASGSIGTAFAAKAPPDGYTLVLGASSTLAVNQSLYKQLSYDAQLDFAPIVLATMQPSVVVVPQSVSANSMQELTSLLISGRVNAAYASAGSGTPSHMGGELFKYLTGIRANHIPYKGGSLALRDLVGGQTTYMFAVLAEAMPLVKSGQLKMLAVTTTRRLPSFPDLPTVAESGVRGFELTSWYGFLAPARTPAGILRTLNQTFNEALRDPEVQRKLGEMGFEIIGGPPAKLSEQIITDAAKWKTLIERAGIKLE